MSKPSLARGTRDFGPEVMAKRTYILQTITQVFKKFGFSQIETPAVENLSVLMGKYGDEGDQLLFKILNSGDFANKLSPNDLADGSKTMLPKIAEKGLRYDLTVPFARFVVMNRHDLPVPFKRYQVQPVWRADRPQKGRYREFYQCDADVVGTDSLLCEAEIIMMLKEAFGKLNLTQYSIKINNRKILKGIAEVIGTPGRESDLCVAIDKLDKIGKEKVEVELADRGFTAENVGKLEPLFGLAGEPVQMLNTLRDWLSSSDTAIKGIDELTEVLDTVKEFGEDLSHVSIDPTLARGLSYYTGAIFEVKAEGVQIGSISGGGRYDDLTGSFGMSDMPGVGISFGVDRIYDVLEELNLFPEEAVAGTQVLIVNFDNDSRKNCLPILKKLRDAEVSAEFYPTSAKLKKQFDYANKKGISYVLMAGSDEINSGKYSLKNMLTGTQDLYDINQIIEILNK